MEDIKQLLYVFNNEFNLYKIGISVDPERRCKEVSNSSGVRARVVRTVTPRGFSSAYDLEQRLHTLLADYRKCGEWFNIDESFLDYVINRYLELGSDKIDITNDTSVQRDNPNDLCYTPESVLTVKDHIQRFFITYGDALVVNEDVFDDYVMEYNLANFRGFNLKDPIEKFTANVYRKYLRAKIGATTC